MQNQSPMMRVCPIGETVFYRRDGSLCSSVVDSIAFFSCVSVSIYMWCLSLWHFANMVYSSCFTSSLSSLSLIPGIKYGLHSVFCVLLFFSWELVKLLNAFQIHPSNNLTDASHIESTSLMTKSHMRE